MSGQATIRPGVKDVQHSTLSPVREKKAFSLAATPKAKPETPQSNPLSQKFPMDEVRVNKSKPGFVVETQTGIQNTAVIVATSPKSLVSLFLGNSVKKSPKWLQNFLRPPSVGSEDYKKLAEEVIAGKKKGETVNKNVNPIFGETNIIFSVQPLRAINPQTGERDWRYMPINVAISPNARTFVSLLRTPLGRVALNNLSKTSEKGKELSNLVRWMDSQKGREENAWVRRGLNNVRVSLNLDLTTFNPFSPNFGKLDKTLAGWSVGYLQPVTNYGYFYIGSRNALVGQPDATDPSKTGNRIAINTIVSTGLDKKIELGLGYQAFAYYLRTDTGRYFINLPGQDNRKDKKTYIEIPSQYRGAMEFVLQAATFGMADKKPVSDKGQPAPTRITSLNDYAKQIAEQKEQLKIQHPQFKGALDALSPDTLKVTSKIVASASATWGLYQFAKYLPKNKVGLAIGIGAGIIGGIGLMLKGTQGIAEPQPIKLNRLQAEKAPEAAAVYWRENGDNLNEPSARLAGLAFKRLAGNGHEAQIVKSWILSKASGGASGVSQLLQKPYNEMASFDPALRNRGVTSNTFAHALSDIGLSADEAQRDAPVAKAYYDSLRANPERFSPRLAYEDVMRNYIYGRAYGAGEATGGALRLKHLMTATASN